MAAPVCGKGMAGVTRQRRDGATGLAEGAAAGPMYHGGGVVVPMEGRSPGDLGATPLPVGTPIVCLKL